MLGLNRAAEMPLRPDEEFVGQSLVAFFGGPSLAAFSEGGDPPDLYLTTEGVRVGVEVTQLSQVTFRPGGTNGNRRTQDAFGLRVLADLNNEVTTILPIGVALLIVLWVPVENPSKYRKALTDLVKGIALSPELGHEIVRNVEGAKVSLKVIPRQPGADAVSGAVANTESSADIGMNARVILEERIQAKTQRCALLPRPLWLALLNEYWLADPDSYVLAAKQIKLEHCFERLFLVSDNGQIREIEIEA